jgi:hypothetical protein
MINKRGDIAVTLLVLMSVFLASVALISFIKDYGKIEAYVINPDFMDNVLYQSQEERYYFSESLRDGLITAYDEDFSNGAFSGRDLNKFKEKIKKYAIEKINSYSFKSEHLAELKNLMNSGKFEVIVLNDKIEGKFGYGGEMLISDEFSYDEKKMVDLAYRPRFTVSFKYLELGLEDFELVGNSISNCKGNEKIEECLNEKLSNFAASKVSDSGGESMIQITSKRDFVIDGVIKKIQYAYRNA